ncbi:MAG TPA: 3'-5' exonuclease [Pyrinomonadaceae bacterium]|jgi:DNA polymerase III epsilon subunit-like protein
MHFNVKQLYTPQLEIYELNDRALVIDTETVGAGPTVEIIEIALGDMNGEIIYESLVRPTFNALPPPSKHHRFDRAELEGAPRWEEIWPQLDGQVAGRLLIAYNAAFDRRAFAAECSRYHQASTERGWRCAMLLVKRMLGTRRSPTLGEACAAFGLEGGNHRAARDVQATCQLLKRLAAMSRDQRETRE